MPQNKQYQVYDHELRSFPMAYRKFLSYGEGRSILDEFCRHYWKASEWNETSCLLLAEATRRWLDTFKMPAEIKEVLDEYDQHGHFVRFRDDIACVSDNVCFNGLLVTTVQRIEFKYHLHFVEPFEDLYGRYDFDERDCHALHQAFIKEVGFPPLYLYQKQIQCRQLQMSL